MRDFATRVTMENLLEDTRRLWARTPERIALRQADTCLTFAALEARADAVAHKLRTSGAKPGDTVGYLGPNGVPFVVSFWACLRAGLMFLPISTRFPPRSVADILCTAGAQFFISDTAMPDDAPDLCHLPLPDEEESSFAFDVAGIPEDGPALANSTSGSTGIPKIVAHTRRTLAAVARFEAAMTGIDETTIAGHCGTMWVASILSTLTAGACVTCLDVETATPQDLLSWLASQRVTYWFSYPSLFRTLEETHGKLPDLRTLLLCGEPLFRRDFELFERMTHPGSVFYNVFGQQELLWGTWYGLRNGDHVAHDKLPAGRAMGANDMQLLDDMGNPVGAGHVGEITHTSPDLPTGYIGNPAQTAKLFRSNQNGTRSFKTGDLGYFDIDGNLHHVGRKDDQIKIRNFNVQPADIEQQIKPHPEVEAVAVTVSQCRRGLPRLVCFYQGRATPSALKDWLSTRIASFMMPQFFVPMKALPRTATGKLQRNRLTLPETLSDAERAPAETPDQETMVQIWAKLLGHDDFGINDNFFDVGGDSLRGMELLLQIENHFGRLLTLDNVILAGATIRGVVTLIRMPAEKSQLRRLKPGSGGPHLVVTHVYGGGVTDYLPFARAIGGGVEVSGVCADYSRRNRAYPIHDKAREAAAVIPAAPAPVLMGFSFGARLAFEIAHLQKTLPRLILIDPIGPFSQSLLKKIADHGETVLRKSPGLGRERTYWRDYWYRPQRLAVENALLITCQGSYPADAAGWRDALEGPVEQFTVPGTHWDVLTGPNAREIAQKVQDWLSRTAP